MWKKAGEVSDEMNFFILGGRGISYCLRMFVALRLLAIGKVRVWGVQLVLDSRRASEVDLTCFGFLIFISAWLRGLGPSWSSRNPGQELLTLGV